jgi:hypothetical protein
MEWARDRATLWNTVEDAGDRRNSRLAREVPPRRNCCGEETL